MWFIAPLEEFSDAIYCQSPNPDKSRRVPKIEPRVETEEHSKNPEIRLAHAGHKESSGVTISQTVHELRETLI